MSKTKLNRSTSPKELYVKVMNLSSKNTSDVNLSKIKEEYDREGRSLKSRHVYSGAGIGVSVALIACLAAKAVGVPISMPEVLTLVSGSLMFGILAGLILS
jgi:hypothetical protein